MSKKKIWENFLPRHSSDFQSKSLNIETYLAAGEPHNTLVLSIVRKQIHAVTKAVGVWLQRPYMRAESAADFSRITYVLNFGRLWAFYLVGSET